MQRIIDFMDFNRLHILLNDFHTFTGFVTAILDLEGNTLCKSGKRRICTECQRVNPDTCKKVIVRTQNESPEKDHSIYKCYNGLYDIVVPIIYEGEHVANLFTGELFFEMLNISHSLEQANKYGFDEKSYLKELDDVSEIPSPYPYDYVAKDTKDLQRARP